MKVIVFGGKGQMGQVLVWAFTNLGHEVIAVDADDTDLSIKTNIVKSLKLRPNGSFENTPYTPDFVMSALPYFLNEKVGSTCIEHKVPYFDLGGHVGTSELLNNLADSMKSIVCTDLGLAPGWVNIIAAHGVGTFSQDYSVVQSVDMAVGGIPSSAGCGVLGYKPSWSIAGLLNEYRDTCKVLQDGEIKDFDGLDGLQTWIINDLHGLELEAFYTSGGSHTTLDFCRERGIPNCAYRTLRWPGHRDIMKWMLDSNLDDDSLEKLINLYSDSAKFSGYDYLNMIVLVCTIKAVEKDGSTLTWQYTRRFFDDQQFTSMQKGTAFPAAAAAHSIMKNPPTGPNSLSYDDVNWESFNNSLKLLDSSLV